VDDQFGRILATLDRLKLSDDTIVVFTSDHGDMMGSHALMGKPHPYDEAFNTPFLIRWPGRIKAAATDDLLLSTPDLMPTLLGLMNLRAQIPPQVQGADHSPIFLGQSGAPRPAYAPYMDSTAGGHRGLRTHTHTLCLAKQNHPYEPPVRLYDNRSAPYQLRNIAAENPALVAALTAETRRWLARVGDPWTES
jgi:arylsulfatase A-like enzyme